MKKPIIITLLFLLSSLILKAQDSTSSHHAQPDSVIKLVPFDTGSHTSYLYTIGGKIVPPEDVKIRILAYVPSAGEYHKARTNITWGIISTAGFASATGAAVIEFFTHSKYAGATTGIVNGQADFIYQQHSHTGAYIFTGLASAFLVSSIINYVHAVKHAHKALNLYNRQFE